MKMLSNGKPNKDGNGTYKRDWGGWSGWYKKKSPTWNRKPKEKNYQRSINTKLVAMNKCINSKLDFS